MKAYIFKILFLSYLALFSWTIYDKQNFPKTSTQFSDSVYLCLENSPS